MSTEAETPAPETNEKPADEEGTWPKGDDSLKVEDIEHTDTPAPGKKSPKHHKSHKHKGDKNFIVDADSEIKVSESIGEDGSNSKKFTVNKSFKLNDEAAEPKEDHAVESEKKESLETLPSAQKGDGITDDKKGVDKIAEDSKEVKTTKVYKYTATFVIKEKNQSRDPGKPGKIITKIKTKTYKCSSDSPIEKESVLVKLKAGEKIEGIIVDLKEETEVKESDDDGSTDKHSIQKENSSDKADQKGDMGLSEKELTPNVPDALTKEKSETKTEKLIKDEEHLTKKTKKLPREKSKESSIDTDVDLDKIDESLKSQDDGKSDGTKESSAEIDHVEMREKLVNLDKEIEKLLKKTEENGTEPQNVKDENIEEALKTEKKDLESTLQTLNDETEYKPRRRRINDEQNSNQSSPKIEEDPKETEPKKGKSIKSDELDHVSKRSTRNKSPDSHALSNVEETDYVPRRRRFETSPDKTESNDTSTRRRKLSPVKTEEDSSTTRRLSNTTPDDEQKYVPKSRIKEGSPDIEDSKTKRSENNADDDEGETTYVPRSRRNETSPEKTDDPDTGIRRRRAKISPEKAETSEYVPRSRRKEASPDKTEENTSRRQRRELSPKSTNDTDYTPRRRRREQSPITESRRGISPVKDTDDYIPRSRRKISDTKTSYDEPSPRKTYAAPSYSNLTANKNSTFNSYKPSSNAYSAYSSYKPESPLTKAKNDYFSMDSYYPGKYSSAPRGERTLGVDPLSIKTYIYEATTGDPSPKKEPSEFESRYAKYLRESTPITELKPKPLYDLDTTKSAHSPLRQSHYDFDPIYKSGPLLRQPSPSYLESRRSRQPSTEYLVRSKSPAPRNDYNYDYDKTYKPLTKTLPSDTYGEKPNNYNFKYYKPSSPLDIENYKSNLRSIYRLDPEGSVRDEPNNDGNYRRHYKNNDIDTETKPSYSKIYGADTPSQFSQSSYLAPHRSIYSDDRYKPSSTIYKEREDPDSKALSDYNNKYRRLRIESPSNVNITLVRDTSEEPRERRSANPPEELLSTSVMPLSEYVMRQTPRRDDPLDYLNLNDNNRRRERAPMSYQASLNYGRPCAQPEYDTYSCLRRNITPLGEPTRYIPHAQSPCNQHAVPLTTPHLRHSQMPIFSQEAALVKRAHQLISKIVADTTAGNSTGSLSQSYQVPRRF